MSKTAALILPGLGGPEALARVRYIVNRWQNKHTIVHIFDSQWDSDELINEKLDRLLKLYDENSGEGRVVVVGFSAGGALATTLLAKRNKIDKVILISAKIKGANTIGPEFVERAPAIITAVESSEKALRNIQKDELTKFVSFRPVFDGVVPLNDMSIEGMRKKRLPITGHAIVIGFALAFKVKRQLTSK